MEETIHKSELDINNLQSQIAIIYRCLYLNQLNESLIIAIENFIAIYLKTYEQYTNLDAPNDQVKMLYDLLSGPINEAYNEHNTNLYDGMPHPAVEIIKNKLDEYHSSLEKSFNRKLTKDGIIYYDDETVPKNGYSFQLLIYVTAIILGVFLGYILYIIK